MYKVTLSKVQQRLVVLAGSRELLSGTSWAYLLKILGLATGYLFAFAVARTLGAEAWGIFSLTITIITFAAILGRFGMDTSLLKMVSRSRAQDQHQTVIETYFKVLKFVIPVSLLITILVYALAPLLANGLFDKPYLTRYFRIGSLAIVPVAVIFVNTQALRGLKQIKESVFLGQVARNLFALVAFLVLVLILVDDAIVVVGFTIGVYVNAIVGTFLFLRIARRERSTIKTGKKTNPVSYRALLIVAVPLLLASSAQLIKARTDTIMLGVFMTDADVGIYNVAFKLATLVGIAEVATNMIAAPTFSEMHATQQRARLEKTVKQSSRLIFFLSLPIFLFFVLVPSQLLDVFGSEYQAAATALVILAAGYLFNAITGPVGVFLQMTGHHLFYQNITLLVVILGVVINLLLIPRLGINGAAIATTIGLIAWNLGCVLFIRKNYGFTSIYNPFRRLASD